MIFFVLLLKQRIEHENDLKESIKKRATCVASTTHLQLKPGKCGHRCDAWGFSQDEPAEVWKFVCAHVCQPLD